MTIHLNTIIHPVKDLAAAKQLYSVLLGVEPYMDEAYYVGFDVDGQQVGLDPNAHSSGQDGTVGYWHVEDIDATLEALVAAGGETRRPVSDVGSGRRIAIVNDVDGNPIGLLQDGDPVES